VFYVPGLAKKNSSVALQRIVGVENVVEKEEYN
jgi:hypothetical protein